MSESAEAPVPQDAARPAHKPRYSRAWWLKLVGLAPFWLLAVFFVGGAARYGWRFAARSHAHDLYTCKFFAVVAVVTIALAYLGWRKPALVGWICLLGLAPFGSLFALWAVGGSWQGVIAAVVVFVGVPVVVGLLLIVAAHADRRTVG